MFIWELLKDTIMTFDYLTVKVMLFPFCVSFLPSTSLFDCMLCHLTVFLWKHKGTANMWKKNSSYIYKQWIQFEKNILKWVSIRGEKKKNKHSLWLISFTSQVTPKDNLHYYGSDIYQHLEDFCCLRGEKELYCKCFWILHKLHW